MSEKRVRLTDDELERMLAIPPTEFGIIEQAIRRSKRKRDYLQEWINACCEEMEEE